MKVQELDDPVVLAAEKRDNRRGFVVVAIAAAIVLIASVGIMMGHPLH